MTSNTEEKVKLTQNEGKKGKGDRFQIKTIDVNRDRITPIF